MIWAEAGCAAGNAHNNCATTSKNEYAFDDRPLTVPPLRPLACALRAPMATYHSSAEGGRLLHPIGRLRLRQAHKAIKGAAVGRVALAKNVGNLVAPATKRMAVEQHSTGAASVAVARLQIGVHYGGCEAAPSTSVYGTFRPPVRL
jgi:hypothetical protein